MPFTDQNPIILSIELATPEVPALSNKENCWNTDKLIANGSIEITLSKCINSNNIADLSGELLLEIKYIFRDYLDTENSQTASLVQQLGLTIIDDSYVDNGTEQAAEWLAE